MMKRILLSLWLLTATAILSAQPRATAPAGDSLALCSAAWRIDTLHGLVCKQVRFVQGELFASNQCITLLEIPFGAADYVADSVARRHAFALSHSVPRSLTTRQARTAGAVAAVNGSFFDMARHHSICYLRIGSREIAPNEAGKDPVNRKYYQTGTLCIDSTGRLALRRTEPPLHWERQHIATPHALTAGPLLLYGDTVLPLRTDRTFVTHRHNRTAVGIRRDGTVLLVVVDGRHPAAAGMSLFELAETLRYLGCVEALNLDGGGSSTLYVEGRPHGGIVNYPSDNGRFDHGGERTVNNCLLVVPR